MTQVVAVKNLSTAVSDEEVQTAMAALQIQINRDFSPIWGIGASLEFHTKSAKIPVSSYIMNVFDNADQAGALGYHDLGSNGQPLGKVFAKTTIDYGDLFSVTFSHEMLEILVDPNINLMALDESSGRAYMYEVCDAVEDDSLGYDINGTTVSDFVLPGWFEPLHALKTEKFAFHNKVKGPFHLLPGGYIGYLDLTTGQWEQLTAKTESNATFANLTNEIRTHLHTKMRPAVGSRRERRRTPKTQWMHSTAD